MKIQVASKMLTEAEQTEWREINFKRCEMFVRRLQQSIAKATQYGNLAKARKLQRILAKSKVQEVPEKAA